MFYASRRIQNLRGLAVSPRGEEYIHPAMCHVLHSFLSTEQLSLLEFQEAVSGRVPLSSPAPIYFNDRQGQKEGKVTMKAPLSKERIATIMSLCKPHWSPGVNESH